MRDAKDRLLLLLDFVFLRIKNILIHNIHLILPIHASTKLLHEALASVTSVHGTATLQCRDQPNMPVELDMQLLVGDEIRSGKETFFTVEFLPASASVFIRKMD